MSTEPLVFPERLALARTATPLQPLDRFSARLGGPRIWVKRDDLTECAASGNKIRKLEFVLARARSEGCDTLITSGGVQSNHCRATALLGARLGMQVHLLLRDEGVFAEIPEGNLLLDYLAGARVSIYPRDRYLGEHGTLVAGWRDHYLAQGCKPWVIPVGASDGHGVWGYIDCARELREDFARAGIGPAAIYHATGSGGTQAGLTVGARVFGLGCAVVGVAVCDDAGYFLDKVRADIGHWRELSGYDSGIAEGDIQVDDRHIGPGYGVAAPEVFETIRELAAAEGLVLDPVYSGKAFHGLVSEIRAGRLAGQEDVVFIHTGGIFGLLAQGAALGFTRPAR
ncbi:MAG: D-cysteine desulfhydrase family protein [Porticoccaceae bacterium]